MTNFLYGLNQVNLDVRQLKDLCEPGGIQTGPFGSLLHQKDYLLEGTPIITVEHLGENRIIHEDLPCVSDEDRNRLSRFMMQEGDIIFSRVGSVDRRSLVRREESGWLFSGRCLRVRPDKTKIDPRYLSWFFGLPSFKEYIRGIAVGATMPSLNTDILSNISIPVPPLPEQRAIADVLSALDDKIELNRRINLTLEHLARALFKHMFIDNPEGAGWEEKPIGDIVTILGGSTPSTANIDFWEGGSIHWATPKDLASLQSPILLDTNNTITELGLKQISSGLLPVGTVLLSSRAPIGYMVITQIPVAINQGFIGIKCTESMPNYYILNWLKFNLEEIIGRANGTTFLEISKSNFRPMLLKIPPTELMETFVSVVEPLYKKMTTNLIESSTLAELRDTLLPKLMSGQVRVKPIVTTALDANTDERLIEVNDEA
jgi:type I restriction enzyme S subunit